MKNWPSDPNEHALPAGVVHKRPGIITRLVFAGILARHLHKSAQRQQADLVIGVAVLNAEQAWTKSDREGFNAHSAELGDQKVAKFVDHHHDADKDDESYCGNEKIMHKRENSDLTHCAHTGWSSGSANQLVSL